MLLDVPSLVPIQTLVTLGGLFRVLFSSRYACDLVQFAPQFSVNLFISPFSLLFARDLINF